MADYDRWEKRDFQDSPFQTLSKQVANLRVQDGDHASTAEEDEPKVVERIESMCISCEENVRL